jgi:predicted pyridoxine 5'-phosphate oxidase superfamily flavin-nucleotide-binding protein
MILNDKVRQALTAGNLAHLVTLNKDGSPQVSIVWAGLDGDEIVCAHLNLYKKLKNIQRDARVALSMARCSYKPKPNMRAMQIKLAFQD